MIPDIHFIESAFNRFNTLIFKGELPTPRFTVTMARTFRGKLCYRISRSFSGTRVNDLEIRISRGFDLPEEEWEDVVIHEMIHLLIVHKKIRDTSSHGTAFRKIMADINRSHGRNIVVSARATGEQTDADRRIRGHYLCIAKFCDGRLGVAPVAKSRIFLLWNDFLKFPEVESLRWVGSTDPWFNRFPRVMTAKLYITRREDLTPHLKGAAELVREGERIRAVSRRCSPDELLP